MDFNKMKYTFLTKRLFHGTNFPIKIPPEQQRILPVPEVFTRIQRDSCLFGVIHVYFKVFSFILRYSALFLDIQIRSEIFSFIPGYSASF